MAKTMSFADDFYTGGRETYAPVPRSDRPTSLIQALASMPDEDWAELCRGCGHNPVHADIWEVLADLQESEVMACDGYVSPITVYLDSAGYITVTVYEDR